MENTKENKITIGWGIYFIISIIIIAISSIAQRSSTIIFLASIFGVMYVLLIAKEKPIAFIFGIINVSIYGYILFTEKIYGGAIYNILYSLPMLILGYIKWKKVNKEKNSGVKQISKKNRIILTIIFSFLIIIYSIILGKTGGNNYILDSITSVLGFLGIYLMSNKYIEQWFTWIIANVTNLILWIILSINNLNNIPMIMMWTIYLINSIYGYVSWKKLYYNKQ